MANPFIVTDEAVLNAYGFRVLTDGIERGDFIQNPVMLLMHNRDQLPIGHWENLRKEGGQLLAEPVFDMNDDLAVKVANKVEGNHMRGASIGIEVLEWSDDPKDMLPGQQRPTVTKSRLYEISIVDVPANSNAVKLRFPSTGVELGFGDDVEKLNDFLPTVERDMEKLKGIVLLLGLADGSSVEMVEGAIKELQKSLSLAQARAEKSVDMLLALGKTKGVITGQNLAHFTKLAKADFDSTLSLIEGMEVPGMADVPPAVTPPPAPTTVTEQLALARRSAPKVPGGEDRTSWTMDDWRRDDPEGLATLRRDEPDVWNELLAGMR